MGRYWRAYVAGEFAELMRYPEARDIRLLHRYARECGLIDICG
jgi:hypothetical protein